MFTALKITPVTSYLIIHLSINENLLKAECRKFFLSNLCSSSNTDIWVLLPLRKTCADLIGSGVETQDASGSFRDFSSFFHVSLILNNECSAKYIKTQKKHACQN